jgi:hypothetical protein
VGRSPSGSRSAEDFTCRFGQVSHARLFKRASVAPNAGEVKGKSRIGEVAAQKAVHGPQSVSDGGSSPRSTAMTMEMAVEALEPQQVEQLEQAAREDNVSRESLLRDAIEYYLDIRAQHIECGCWG